MADVGVMSASFFYPYLLLQIPAGIVVDRLGVRRPLIFSIILCTLATLIFAVSQSALVAEAARLMMGMGSAPAVVCAMCLGSRWFPKPLFPMLAGMVEMLGMIGGAFGEYGISLLINIFTWRGALIFCVGAAILLIIAIIRYVVDWPNEEKRRQYYQEQKRAAPSENFFEACREIVCLSQVWIACLYGGLMFSIIAAFSGLWAVPFLEEAYGMTTPVAAGASAMMLIGSGLGAPVMGWLSCRVGSYRRIMIVMSLLAMLCFGLILWVHIPYPLLCFLMLLLGLSAGAYALCFSVVKHVTCASMHGMALGFTNMMAICLGAPVLQPLIGWLLEENQGQIAHLSVQDYWHAFRPLWICLLIALVLATLIRERPCKQV